MSPVLKRQLIDNMKDFGNTVLMCGDGANDCGALKAADVGISLSEAEASAAAPFTSHDKNVSCVLSLVSEGRASLTTSLSCFKYMALYSVTEFTTTILLYSFTNNIGDLQYLYIDLILIPPLSILSKTN
jgi:cation-transporting ATPase 13A3/4/5